MSQTITQDDDHITPELTQKRSNLVGAGSAGIRAVMYQLTNFYLRTPVKLFRPTRVDYMAITRLFVKNDYHNRNYNVFKDSSIAILIRAIKQYGWRFIPERVLPPLVANSATGVVLYTSYLMSLQYFNGDKKNFLENPSPFDTIRAGFVAGTFQSIAAAPIDAIYARSSANEILQGDHQNLWKFGLKKLNQIGFSGVFAGYGLSFVKESFGFAAYFCIFETVKNQLFQITRDTWINYRYYKAIIFQNSNVSKSEYYQKALTEKKMKALKTSFVFLGGITASFTLLALQYPINKIQNIHFSILEAVDIHNNRQSSKFLTIYYNTYVETFEHVLFIQSKSKMSWFDWLYKGFRTHALSTIPATTIGLVSLEYMRNKLSVSFDAGFE